MDGSVDNVCNVDDGKCTCKDNIDGHNCDKSAKGWWNFPTPQGKINFQEIRVKDILIYLLSLYRMFVS